MAEGGDAPQHIQLKAFLKLSVAGKIILRSTVDGSEILHQLRCSLSESHYLQGLYIPRWLALGLSSINTYHFV